MNTKRINYNLRIYAIDKLFYTTKELGPIYSKNKTTFNVWAPTATELNLIEYKKDNTTCLHPMFKGKDGVFSLTLKGDLDGFIYNYQVHFDNTVNIAVDPYVKATTVNGEKGVVVNLAKTNPRNFNRMKSFSKATDAIIYEISVRDFTVDEKASFKHKAQFLGLCETKALKYLKNLGVTHVQLMPIFNFSSESVDELKPLEKYNWGYDPVNYNVVEGAFATDPTKPSLRIKELKTAIKALHDNGIRVIMDVVYNHTYVTDGSNFNLTVPGYYYRHNPDGTYSDASYCGNETASEREMVRRYIVQSALYWVKEYHIDGFRFDLMGIHDLETMNMLRDSLNRIDPSIFVYGEGWTAGPSPYPQELRAMKTNAPQMPGIAVFNDDVRDVVKGSFKKDENRGFATGKLGLEESVKFGIVAATQHPQIDYSQINYSTSPYALYPSQSINYVSSHDDLCLVDKLIVSLPENTSESDLIRYDKLAQTIIFTSQGIPFMFNGEEVFRSKKLVHNSFESPDSINQINWANKSIYYDLFDYYKKLIALRKKHSAFRMVTTTDIQSNLHFEEHLPENVIAYRLNGKAAGDIWSEIFVAFNGNNSLQEISIPDGNWTIVCLDGKIDEAGISSISGNKINLPRSSAVILKR